MQASVEQPDGSYKSMEMGEPVCGEDFCDRCGDCITCYGDDPGWEWGCTLHPSWVIYLNNEKNPNYTP